MFLRCLPDNEELLAPMQVFYQVFADRFARGNPTPFVAPAGAVASPWGARPDTACAARAPGRFIPPSVDAEPAGPGYLAQMSLPPALPASPRPSTLPAAPAPAQALLTLVTDQLAAALLVLQADGTLLHANAAAQALLQDGQAWQLDAAHRLRPTPPAAHAGFESALATARALGAPCRLPLAEPAGARLSVLPGPEGSTPCLLLSLQPAPGLAADLPSYAAAHGLSPTETRVLQRLALGEGSARAAAALGLQATTVRTHVLALRRKTGQPTLAALVQTLGRLPPVRPLAHAGPAAAGAGASASPR